MALFSRYSRVLRVLNDIDGKVTQLMAAQDDVNSAAAALVSVTNAIQQVASDLNVAVTNIQAEIAALKAANPAVDTTALNTAVAGIAAPLAALQSADSAVQGLESPPPAPPAGP